MKKYVREKCDVAIVRRIIGRMCRLWMLLVVFAPVSAQQETNVTSGFPQLDEWVKQCKVERPNALGYPGNYDSKLDGFYRW